jgi:hypothetical protein
VSTAALGSRSTAPAAALELRIRDLERAIGRVASRTLNGSPGYDSKRISANTDGWDVGTWVQLSEGTWTIAATSDDFAPDAIGVVLLVIDGTTAEIVTGGYVQLLGTSYTGYTRYYLSTTPGEPTGTKPTAPDVAQPLFIAHQDGWIEVDGPAGACPRSVSLWQLLDVDGDSLDLAADGDLLTYDLAAGKWKAAAGGLSSLGARAALSVVGRSANTPGTAADIVAANTGDVLYMGASSLVWGQLSTASYQDASVSAAKLASDVVLNALQDVSVTGAASLDFLRFNGTAWVNQSLGELVWVSATREFALDGGNGATAASVVGIGKSGSRLLVSGGCSFDFLLSGLVGSGTDISGRIRVNASGGPIGFYDQATSTFASGTEVMQWGTNATAGSRYFRFKIPLHVFDGGSKNLVLTGSSQVWTIGDDVTPTTHLTFYGAGADAYGARMALGSDLDLLGGRVFYANRASGTSSSRIELIASDGTWYQSGNLSHRAGNTLRLFGDGSAGVLVGVNGSDKVGFWGTAAVTKTTVSDPSAITVSGTATGTDAAMVNALKTDVTNLRASLLAAIDALQACGIF